MCLRFGFTVTVFYLFLAVDPLPNPAGALSGPAGGALSKGSCVAAMHQSLLKAAVNPAPVKYCK